MLTLAISIVNYNSRDDLDRCLASLAMYPPAVDYKVWVIDNASAEPIADLAKKYKDVTFVFNTKNVGFTVANNAVIRRIESRYHIVANPDIVLTEGALDGLVAYCDAHPEVGVIAPRLTYADGSLQYSCRTFPTLTTFLTRGFFEKTMTGPMRRYLMADWDHASVRDVDWILGCFLFMRRSAFDAIGGFDEGFFIYYEDIDLCYRMKRAGWRVVYYPLATITHAYKRASAEGFFTKLKYIHTKSAMRFFMKHLFRRGWRTFV